MVKWRHCILQKWCCEQVVMPFTNTVNCQLKESFDDNNLEIFETIFFSCARTELEKKIKLFSLQYKMHIHTQSQYIDKWHHQGSPVSSKVAKNMFFPWFFFFHLEETVFSSFFRWNSEETQNWGEIVFSVLIHLRFLISFFFPFFFSNVTKLLHHTKNKIGIQDDPLSTYISC